MNKESLIKIRNAICGIIDTSDVPTVDKLELLIDTSDIPIVDKLELLINLYHYLDPDKYERNISILREYDEKERLGHVKYKTNDFR